MKNKSNNKKKMSKRLKGFLIVIGVVLAIFIALLSFIAIKISDKGINIFTGQMTGESAENLANNSLAPDISLDYDNMFSDRDLEQEVDISSATNLSLENDNDLVISDEGTYVLNGTYTNTMIVVDVEDDKKVQLVLDNLSIENQDKPAIYVKSGDKVFITTTASTNNISITNKYEADGETSLDAAIFSTIDITLNGLGTLDIISEEGNGISGKDDLKITGGIYNITSKDDGIEANDSVRIYGGSITIDSQKDAIHSENSDDDSLGYVYIENGTLNISAKDDGIRGNSAVVINGGNINIEICAEGVEASQVIINDGNVTIYSEDDGVNATYKTSYRAMIEINGGVLNITMSDGDTDGVDSNGDFAMYGGEINVIGGMAAFDVDGDLIYDGGLVTVDGVVQDEIVIQSFGIGMMGNKDKR